MWYGDPGRRPMSLQAGIATAMITVKMSIDNLLERLSSKGMPNQCDGLVNMADVAGIDHSRRFLFVPREDYVVSRKPSAN